jgi:hypothetical protein
VLPYQLPLLLDVKALPHKTPILCGKRSVFVGGLRVCAGVSSTGSTVESSGPVGDRRLGQGTEQEGS